MKRTLLYISLGVAVLVTGCDKDFEDINTDPNKTIPPNFNSDYFLSGSQYNYINGITGYNGAILFQSGWVQIFSSTSSGAATYYSNMDKYVASGNTNDYAGRGFDLGYKGARLAQEIIKNYGPVPATPPKTDKTNVVSAAKVMKVLCMQYVTDLYGDVPYSQAFLAPEPDNVTTPAYDKQQDIYNSMLSELDTALLNFDTTKPKPVSDLFPYAGDVAKWKKFGYSLMLRVAMRLTKADPATAQKYAEKAAAGGTLSSVSEDAWIKGDNPDGYRSENSRALITPADFYSVRWSKTFMDYLKANNDPRVTIIAEVPDTGLANNSDILRLTGNNSYAIQLGQPNGWDLNGGPTDIKNSTSYPGGTGSGDNFTPIGKYSRPRAAIYTNLNSPQFVLTYAESELLLAEAKARGWNVGATTAAAHYAKGLSAALQALTPFGGSAALTPTFADAYAAAHPLDVSSLNASLKMINEQYWATTGILLNFVEAWNNWKRSGYPVLTPIVYVGNFSKGQIPRRQLYPTTESTTNPANYKNGVGNLTGGDDWLSRTWWDK
ncbi:MULTISPECIES: SusD/RagB family nutrient-binding outer membrane lipoprotein [Niastella]|uniref:SusD/RagB family nutrient-binding outer membrane lipoprotein n=1 Tax=Niastella soli TaxID=2821487 RepID=A0ABS3YU22_9BACT|nr:SusD/RagB family nutrient-binding outer membrane lipoprotein [Niastella soli]MBO9200696.1 SusD/RagB family nutrient-binding outer membrane lipoprotein [Niastella soli]